MSTFSSSSWSYSLSSFKGSESLKKLKNDSTFYSFSTILLAPDFLFFYDFLTILTVVFLPSFHYIYVPVDFKGSSSESNSNVFLSYAFVKYSFSLKWNTNSYFNASKGIYSTFTNDFKAPESCSLIS